MEQIQKVTPNLIRVDKNLSLDNGLQWLNLFKDDAQLCFDIIVYMANNSQKDLFNYGIIDIKHFAQVMGYKKENLQRLVAKPYQEEVQGVQVRKFKREERYITLFENAFYKLGMHNIPMQTTYQTKEGTDALTRFIQIIKETKIHTSNRAKTKIIYSYRTSEEFDYNLSRFFFLVDLNLINELRKKNLLLLYFYIKNIENSKHLSFVEKDFKKVCGFACVHDTSVSTAKQKLKHRKFKPLQNYINFSYEFVNASGKWNFGLNLTFPDNQKFLLAPKSTIFDHDQQVLIDADVDYIDLKLMLLYREKYKQLSVTKEQYRQWLFSPADEEEKHRVYFSSLAELRRIDYSAAKKQFASSVKNFFSCTSK